MINGKEYSARDPDNEDEKPTKAEETNSYALIACVIGIGAIVLYSTN